MTKKRKKKSLPAYYREKTNEKKENGRKQDLFKGKRNQRKEE
jgi:hypothetical protein